MVANDNTIALHSDAKIPLSDKLSQKVQHAFLFENLKIGAFISIGLLCDDDCIAFF